MQHGFKDQKLDIKDPAQVYLHGFSLIKKRSYGDISNTALEHGNPKTPISDNYPGNNERLQLSEELEEEKRIFMAEVESDCLLIENCNILL